MAVFQLDIAVGKWRKESPGAQTWLCFSPSSPVKALRGGYLADKQPYPGISGKGEFGVIPGCIYGEAITYRPDNCFQA